MSGRLQERDNPQMRSCAVAAAMRRANRKDLAQLKRVLEAGA